MKSFIGLALVICLIACNKRNTSPINTNGPLRLLQTIPLPNVEGRIDHLAIDSKSQRLFVAALGNNTVEIIDLMTGKVIHSISGLSEPQGIIFIPESNKIFVANGGDGTCKIFDGNTLVLLDTLNLSSDADNIRYDDQSKIVYVGHGDGALSLIDPATDKVLEDIKLAGHPESFQLESSNSKIFINIPSASQIAVVDSQKQRVIATWLMTNDLANYPMALDEGNHRLLVGFRVPSKVGIYNSETGNFVTGLDSVGDTDDIFYDAAHKMVFVIGGAGHIDVFSQQDADHYELLAHIPTAAGARTGLWVAESNRLYIAVPHHGTQQAEIQVYELQP